MKYIELDKNLMPYSFEIELDGNIFRMEVNYNARFDFFTLDLYYEDEALILGEKLQMNEQVFEVIDYIDVVPENLIPADLTYLNTRITWDNLGEQVFLYVGDDIE